MSHKDFFKVFELQSALTLLKGKRYELSLVTLQTLQDTAHLEALNRAVTKELSRELVNFGCETVFWVHPEQAHKGEPNLSCPFQSREVKLSDGALE